MTDAKIAKRPGRVAELAGIVGFFSALTLLFTYPIWTRPNTYLTDLADVRLVAWIMAWDAHALLHQPTRLFDANIFFPSSGTLAYSEAFIGEAISVAPLNWLGLPILAYNVALLSAFILSGVGATLWVRHLTGSLIAGLFAGVIWAFAPAKFNQLSHLHMIAGQWIPFALLSATRWVESGRVRHVLATAAFAGLQFAFSMHYGLYLVPILSLYAVAILVGSPASPVRSAWRCTLRQLVAATLLYLALTLPLALPYSQATDGGPRERSTAEHSTFSARPYSFLSGSQFNTAPHVEGWYRRFVVPEANLFIGLLPLGMAVLAAVLLLVPAGARRRRAEPAAENDRARAAPPPRSYARWSARAALAVALAAAALHLGGFVAAAVGASAGWPALVVALCRSLHPTMWLAIALTALIVMAPLTRNADNDGAGRRKRYQITVVYVATMVYLLAYGPEVQAWRETLGHGPYWLLSENLAPFRGIRAVGRIGLVWVLFAAALAGFSLSRALRYLPSRRLRWGLAALVLLVTLAEYRVWPLPYGDNDVAREPIHAWLAQQPGDFAVVHVPVQPNDDPWRQTRYMLGSTQHWKRLVNGYSGYFPADYRQLAEAGLLTPEFFDTLRADFPVRYLLIHDDLLANEEQHALLHRLLEPNRDVRFLRQIGTTYVFEVPRDRDSGHYVRRRYLAEQLRDASGAQFLMRGPGIEASDEVFVLAGWGSQTQRVELLPGWHGVRVPLPQGFHGSLNGSPGRLEVRVHRLVELGTTGARIASGFTADVEEHGAGVGLDTNWAYRNSEVGYQLHILERFGTVVAETAEFSADDNGARALRAHVESLTSGVVAALTVSTGAWRRLRPELIDAMRMLGGDPATDEPIGKMVVVGRRGAPPGAALQHEHHRWATIDIEVDVPTVELRSIGLY